MSTNRSPFQVVHDQKPMQSASATELTPTENFPSSRYFQVHFEHLHENNLLLQKQLSQLEKQIEQLNRKLERMHRGTDRVALAGMSGEIATDPLPRNSNASR